MLLLNKFVSVMEIPNMGEVNDPDHGFRPEWS